MNNYRRRVFSLLTNDASRPPSLFQELADSLCATLFPSACPLCGQESATFRGAVCAACWSRLEPWRGPACLICGLPFPSVEPEAGGGLCGPCRKDEYDFDRARSFGIYAGTLRAAILQLKFYGREPLGLRLGALLAGLWDSVEERLRDQRSVVIPVPLHRSRQRERGFNQAELLSKGFRKALRASGSAVPKIETDCLRRTRWTKPQTGLTLRTRLENVRGAFKVHDPERIRERNVVLVDDVMTTGATASACATALKRAGARTVVVLTVARATPQFPDLVVGARTGSGGIDGTDAVIDDAGRERG